LRLAAIGVAASLVGAGRAAAFETLELWAGAQPAFFTLDDLDRRPVSLADFRGRPAIVHFFATWCEPCLRELPALAALHDRHRSAELAILAISVNEPDIRVRRFFERAPVPFPVLLDRDRAIAKGWRADVLPTSILLDRSLTPHRIVEGEFDWSTPSADDAIAALAGHSATPQDEASTIQGGKG
jgi:peroxiredoxin